MSTSSSKALNTDEFDDSFFEWEERDESVPYYKHMIAGSIAGVVEHCCLFPFDSIKTHMQTLKKETKVSQIAKHMYREGGVKRFWRGVSVMASGCVPAHALYFSVYEGSKKFLITRFGTEKNESFLFALTGALATLTHDFILTPYDTMKQRIQIAPQHIKNYKGLIKFTYQTEGIGAFYKSYPITTMMNIPNAAILVGTNETLKKYYRPEGGHNFFSYLLCGSIAGSTAAMCTIPLDVIKTKLQCQNFIKTMNTVEIPNKNLEKFGPRLAAFNLFDKQERQRFLAMNYRFFSSGGVRKATHSPALEGSFRSSFKLSSIKNAITTIYREEGARGFVKGVGPRMVAMAPSSAISWTAYEMIKKSLNVPTVSH